MSEATRALLLDLIRHAKGMVTAFERWVNAQPDGSKGAGVQGSKGNTGPWTPAANAKRVNE